MVKFRNNLTCMLMALPLLWSLGCDSSGSSTTTSTTLITNTAPLDTCSLELKNKFVYDVMKDEYLWYDKVPDTDYTLYESPERLLEDLIYEPYDKWSYISSKEEFYAYYTEGKYIGAGMALGYDLTMTLRIKYIHPGSPADRAGLKRGDKLLKINGKSPDQITQENLWNDILGPDDAGVSISLEIENSQGVIRSVSFAKEWVQISTVLKNNVVSIGGKKIGYLAFIGFLTTSISELDRAFSSFKNEGIEELILDLRYNSGGLGIISLYLADLICGDRFEGETFVQFIHNNKYSHLNHLWVLSKPRQPLNLKRLFVITTRSTCSASEMIINGLTPYIDVVIIGNTTCGKPVGMYGHDYCDIHLSPIEFKIANAFGEGDYYWGIAPDCFCEDDLSRDFGDLEEASLKETVGYIRTGSCSRSSQRKIISEWEIPMSGLKKEIGAF